MATLPTNFKDDILDTSVNTRRKYRVYENTDGTIELEDVTEYSQVGDVFGAGQINSTNTEVNKKFDKNMLVRDLDTINAITKEGYAPDALALKEVNQSLANGQISFDVVDGEPYVAVNGGTPRPFDSRHFIIKDGVVQDGFTPNLFKITTEYDETRGMLKCLKTDTTNYGNISFLVDLTDYDFVFGTLFPYDTNNSNLFYNSIKKITVLDNYNTNEASENPMGIGGRYDVSNISGSKYILVGGCYSNNIEDYSFCVKDLWLE